MLWCFSLPGARSRYPKFRRISEPDEIRRVVDSGEQHYRIYTKDPSVQAFTDLLNRALDKPSEHVEVSDSDDGPIVIRWQTHEKPGAPRVRNFDFSAGFCGFLRDLNR